MKINLKDLKSVEIDKDSIDTYIDFIDMIKSKLERQEFLGDFTKEELIDILDNKGHIYMYKYLNVYASCSVLIPGSKEDLEELELKDINYKELIEIGPQAVFEDFRGNNIQDYMIKEMEAIASKHGYKHILTSAHPENTYSVNNFIKNNYKIIATKEYKRGIRNIYYKDI